jgi:hypothetical protein
MPSPDSSGAGRVIQSIKQPDPSTRPALQLGEPMSLYRAALRLARLLPLGVAKALPGSLLQVPSGFADVSPVFTLRLPAKATIY